MISESLQSANERNCSTKRRLSVGFLLLKQFTLCAFANFVDVLRLAADDGDGSRAIRCQWRVISRDHNAIQSSCGVAIQPQELLGDPRRFDYIVVVGGLINDNDEESDMHLHQYLRRAASLDITLIGLCTGSFTLYRARLMDGYRCCISWFHDGDFLRRFEGLKPVSNQIFVVDRDRMTCSGGASTAHLAAFVVERHLGQAAASKSLRIMMFDEAAKAEAAQPAAMLDVPVRDQVVKKALLLMQQNLDVPLSIASIAGMTNVSKRRIERLFRKHLEMPPLQAYAQIRVDHARHLLARTTKSIAEIASESGYCDASHLGRIFRTRYKTTPQQFRLQSSGSDRGGLP